MAYTTHGRKRGSCTHVHKTIAAAFECARQDTVSQGTRGQHSDRVVVHCDGSELSERELEIIAMLLEARGV